MHSPPRLRRSPPRRALHERSESQTNERGSPILPSIQIPQEGHLEKTPFPTKPSQVLIPSVQYPAANQRAKGTPSKQVPFATTPAFAQEAEPTKSSRVFASREQSDADRRLQCSSTDLSFYTASAINPTAFATPILERSERSLDADRANATIRKVMDEHASIEDPAAEPQDETTRTEAPNDRQPSNKDSDNSLSSTNTTGTMVMKKTRDGKKRASYSAFPYSTRPNSSRSNVSSPSSLRSSPNILQEPPTSRFSGSPITAGLPAVVSKEWQISSAHAESDASKPGESLARLQYPIIRPASASGSWAEISTFTQVPPRAVGRTQRRWNPHLSTVRSVGTNSMSGERSSQGLWLSDPARASQSSSKVFSIRMSLDQPTNPDRNSPEEDRQHSGFNTVSPTDKSSSAPPNLPPAPQRGSTGSTIRVVREREEREKLNVPPTIPGSRDSFQPNTIGTSDDRREPLARPSSRASFFRDSIPAWARSYYAHPPSDLSPLDQIDSITTDNISLNLGRPRNRDQHMPPQPSRRRSGLAMHPTRPDELFLADARGMSGRISPTLSPHLWHDRTSLGRRRSIFKAPSVDEKAEGNSLTKRNAQVFCFTLGFVLPLAWFLAAVLPLPRKPALSSLKGKNIPRGSTIAIDLENRRTPTDLARYENARWWRNINRIMCLVGTAIIISVIALAVIGAT